MQITQAKGYPGFEKNQASVSSAASVTNSYSYPNLLVGNSSTVVLSNLSATSSGGGVAGYPMLNTGGTSQPTPPTAAY